MKRILFRFKTLLDLHAHTEDMLKQEVARLQREKAKAVQRLELLHKERTQTKRTIASGGEAREIHTTLQYVELLSRHVEEANRLKDIVAAQVEAGIEALKKAKMERKRFEILQNHSMQAAERMRNREEQKVLDDYSQRKTNV